MRKIIWGLILAAVFGGATYISGDRFIPAPDLCRFIPVSGTSPLGTCIDDVELATLLAAFIGWSMGLLIGGSR